MHRRCFNSDDSTMTFSDIDVSADVSADVRVDVRVEVRVKAYGADKCRQQIKLW